MLYTVRVWQEVRLLGGGGRDAARAQARADRARLPPPQRVHHARPPVHLAGRLAPRPRGLLPRPHRAPRLPRRRQAREVNYASPLDDYSTMGPNRRRSGYIMEQLKTVRDLLGFLLKHYLSLRSHLRRVIDYLGAVSNVSQVIPFRRKVETVAIRDRERETESINRVHWLRSGSLSSSWAANLPRFVRRRDALVLPAHHHSLSSTPDRRNSQVHAHTRTHSHAPTDLYTNILARGHTRTHKDVHKRRAYAFAHLAHTLASAVQGRRVCFIFINL